jgi:cell division protein FtsA
MSRDKLVVGLDIGTTKIAALVAEQNQSDKLKLLGFGTHPSEGLRKGVVVNLEKTVESIMGAIQDAELMLGQKIDSVYAGIAGDHIKGINSRGVIAVKGSDSEISPVDVDRVIDAARAVAIPLDREIIHVLPQEFIVDDQSGIRDPIGMSGVRLEADVHIVTGAIISAQNIYKSIRRAGLEVKDLVLEPLASSYALLAPEEEELGVLLIDLGGGTTDIALFYDGCLRHTAVVGLGGKNITNDIAIGLRTPVDQAEILKKNFGCALARLADPNEMIEVPGVGGRKPKQISRSVLAAIIEPRVEEIYSLVLKEIRRTEFADCLAAGIVLTGGGSLMQGMAELAEQVFDMPAKMGCPGGIEGLSDVITNPMHSTGVGLLLWGFRKPEEKRNEKEKNLVKRTIYRMKNWLGEYF